MNILRKYALGAFFLLPVILFAENAAADKQEHKGRGHGHKYKLEYSNHDDHEEKSHKKNRKKSEDVAFASMDKIVIREYLAREYSNCPPGLAKKHNGCLPPGLAKKHYSVGHSLRGGWHELPHELLEGLGDAPTGYRYVMVDKDVLLISEASKKVIDAVTLISAVGK